jgi:uncharacterized protein (TIGR02466 family)
MTIQLWFPTSIYVEENIVSDEENDSFITEIEKLKSKISVGGSNWNTDVYNTCDTYDLRKNKILKNLCKKIEEHTNIFAKQLNSQHNYKITDCWFNYYNKNDFQETHHHANSIFSAVYFFTNPKNCGVLSFENPIEPDMLPLKNITEFNNLNSLACNYNPLPKTLIIFRSNIRHMVSRGDNVDPRITAAFNLQ